MSHVPAITRLRSAMYERKGLDFGPAKVLASYVATHVTCRNYSLTAIAYDAGAPLAGFSGMEFGPNTYYIDGGSLPANKGAAWLIQMVMLKRAWERPRDAENPLWATSITRPMTMLSAAASSDHARP